MDRKPSRALFTVLVLLCSPVLAQQHAFELKGNSLGMTLAQFRTLHHLTQVDDFGVKASSEALCTSDAHQSPETIVSDEEEAAGLIRCVVPQEMTLANVQVSELTFDFFEGKLFRIRAFWGRDGGRYETVRSAVLKKFGSPSTSAVHHYQNYFGANVLAQELIWTRPDEICRLVERTTSDIDVSGLEVLQTSAQRKFSRLIESKKKPDL